MTPRDRSLLRIVLCAAVLLIGVRFLIMPALDSRTELEQELESVRMTEMEYKSQIAALGGLDADIAEAEDLLEKAGEPYTRACSARRRWTTSSRRSSCATACSRRI